MAPPDDRRARILGIPVRVPLSGILGIALLAYLWAPSFVTEDEPASTAWVLAVAFAVLLAGATMVHEFAHALLARRLGFPVHEVVLQLMGGATHYERKREAPLAEAAIAAAGPAATFALAAASYGVAAAVEPGSVPWMLARALLWANLVIGVFNSLPGLPLDGGGVLRGIVWAVTGSERRGTVVAAWSGRIVAMAVLLMPVGMSLALGVRVDVLLYVLAGLLAAMLYTGATTQLRAVDLRERAAGLSAGGLARRAIPVDPDLPLAEAIRRATSVGASALVVVDKAGTPTAIGHNDAIAAVPVQRRPWIPVSSVATPIDAEARVDRGVAGRTLLAEVARSGRQELLVVDAGGLVYGVLVVADLEAALRG